MLVLVTIIIFCWNFGFRKWVLCHDEAIELLIYNSCKCSVSRHYPINLADAALNTLQHVKLFDFLLSSYWIHLSSFLILSIFLRSFSIVEMLTPMIWNISMALWDGFCLTSRMVRSIPFWFSLQQAIDSDQIKNHFLRRHILFISIG